MNKFAVLCLSLLLCLSLVSCSQSNDYCRTLVTINWHDVTEEGDDHVTEGRKMADALISSDQEFLKR